MKLRGFAVCMHTCEGHKCTNPTTMTLSKMERRSTGTSSSIDLFCRIDMGVIQMDDGRLNYFVNEVESGPNVCLWAGGRWPQMIGDVAAKLGLVLQSWIKSEIDI